MLTLPTFALIIICIALFLGGIGYGVVLGAPTYISQFMIKQIKEEMKKKGANAFYVQSIHDNNGKGI